MNAAETEIAAEFEAIKALKARYCRFFDTKDFDSWRGLFTDDVQVRLEMSVSSGRTDVEPVACPAASVRGAVPPRHRRRNWFRA